MRAGRVGLDGACDDIHRRSLGGNDQVYANGTGELSQAGDRHFHFFACRRQSGRRTHRSPDNEWQVLMSPFRG